MKYTYVTPQMLQRIEDKTNALARTWGYCDSERWQLWQMVATIESGLAKRTRCENSGIVVDGWNDADHPDPCSAWGGFYRMEPAQMVGWTLRLVYLAEPENRERELSRVAAIYGLFGLRWENEPRTNGWVGWQCFETEQEAERIREAHEGPGYKRARIVYSEMTGCHCLEIESTRKPSLDNVFEARIAR